MQPPTNPVTNTASMSYSYSPIDGGIPSVYDVNSNEVDVDIISADLSVTKTVDNNLVHPRDTVLYTITVTNNGPYSSENTLLVDNVPSDLRNVSFSLDGGATWNTWTGSLNLGTLAPNTSVTILINGIVHSYATGTFTNIASVTSDVGDPDLTNNSDSVDVTVETIADISVVKTASPSGVTIRRFTNLHPNRIKRGSFS